MNNFLKVKLLDRYLAAEIIEPLIFGILSFTMILAGGAILLGLVKEIIRYSLSLSIAVKFFILRLPGVMVYTFPMAMLLATILAISRMSTDGEITAFKAAGINLTRLALPIIFVGFGVSLITLFFNENLVPQANRQATKLFLKVTASEPPKIKENINLPIYEKGSLARVLSARKLEGNLLKDVTIQEFEKGRLARIVMAKEALWNANEGWLFKNGRLYQIAPDEESLYVIKFQEEFFPLPSSPKELSEEEIPPEEMNWVELKKYIGQLAKRGEETTFHKVQLNFKLAIPFASLIFALVGLPLGAQHQRRAAKSVGFGLSLLVIFAYYLLFSISMGLGSAQVVSPGLAAWLPNFLIGGFAIYLLRRASN